MCVVQLHETLNLKNTYLVVPNVGEDSVAENERSISPRCVVFNSHLYARPIMAFIRIVDSLNYLSPVSRDRFLRNATLLLYPIRREALRANAKISGFL